MNINFDKKLKSLSQVIQRQIGDRVLAAFCLLIILLLSLARSELIVWSEQVRGQVIKACQKLEDYTISQALLQNEEAVQNKIQQFNDENPHTHIRWMRASTVATDPELRWQVPVSWHYNYKLREMGGQQFGSFEVAGSLLADKELFSELLLRIILLVVFSGLIILILFPLGRRIPQLLIFQPINGLLKSLQKKSNQRFSINPDIENTLELHEIREQIKSLLKEAEEASRGRALIQIASQVAHDIRSPLAAMSTFERELAHLSEGKRILLRKSVNRIRDIANNLLRQNRDAEKVSISSDGRMLISDGKRQIEILSLLVESTISEARQRFKSATNLTIDGDWSSDVVDGFVDVDPIEFHRLLSNLINNSVEALDSMRGFVKVEITRNGGDLVLKIKDNGKGIPADVLPTLGKIGRTFAKAEGNGIGLYHAKTCIESWGGNFRIQSAPANGTEIEVTFQEASKPKWFASKILIDPTQSIVVLDDDESIHHVWGKRLSELEGSFIIHHISEGKHLRKWIAENPNARDARFLIDFELNGATESGLDLIEELDLGPHSTLVTSRYDEEIVRERCVRLNVKMLPKSFAAHVRLELLETKTTPDLVLIDDDDLVHLSWKTRAADKNKKLQIFENEKTFLAASVSKDIPIFIDFHLADQVSGLDVAKELKERGYKDLSITTGDEKIVEMPSFIKSVCGKDFPLE